MRHVTRRRAALAMVACSALTLAAVAPAARAQQVPVPSPLERAFALVAEGIVAGDLLLAGNSNMQAAGIGAAPVAADIDGDDTVLCAARLIGPAGCSDNSSTALLDLPAGARVLQARLYVDTTLDRGAAAVRARLDGPAASYSYTMLDAATTGIPKLWEATGSGAVGGLMRQAVWDVTAYVRANGPGRYTVADIVADGGPSPMPYATWAIMVLYDLDPASGVDVATLPVELQDRFTRRAVSWHDGFVVQREGRLDVATTGFEVPPAGAPFAKSFHVVVHSGAGSFDNLVFDGEPLGNSAAPDNGGPPPGVVVGVDLACNSIVDVFNDSICVLGTSVGASAGVDVDVTRIPDRYLHPAATDATLSMLTVADDLLAPGLLAVSIDLGPEPPEPPTTEPAP